MAEEDALCGVGIDKLLFGVFRGTIFVHELGEDSNIFQCNKFRASFDRICGEYIGSETGVV